MEPSWSERLEQSHALPNLGLGGTLVTVFITSFFAAELAGVLCIALAFGAHAYFVEGLRLADWKHGILSNGQSLPWPSNWLLGICTLLVWAALIGGTELVAGLLTRLLKRLGPLVTWGFRCIGGVALLGFSTWIYARGHTLLHPIPLSALVGGVVLIWKGVAQPLSVLINRVSPRGANACRLTGGTFLIAASLWLLARGQHVTNPFSLSLFIVGVALICRGTAGMLRDGKQ
jgi:hypothetical protein